MGKIKTICCLNKQRVIGNDNKLLYHLPNDMQNFKSLTMGNIVLMGRKTFESFPGTLDGRTNIVMTSDRDYFAEPSDNLYIVHSINDALELAYANFQDKDIFVIGGETVYNQFLERDIVDEQYLTIVSDEKEGDTFYPEGYDDASKWRTLYRSYSQRDKGNDLSYIFTVLKRERGTERD